MIRRYKLREFDVAAEQFFPGEGNPLPLGIIQLGNDCWHLGIQEKWSESGNLMPQSQTISSGDWIVRTNRGEIYRMSDKDFHVTYEAHAQIELKE